jgi:HEAT repeat protein
MNSSEFKKLVEKIKSKSEENVILAARRMSETGDERFLKEIRDVLAEPDISGNQRYHLRKAYNKLVEKCLGSTLVSEPAQDEISDGPVLPARINISGLSLDHPDPERRIAALRSAAKLKNPDIIPHLLSLLEKEENLLVKATFLKTLGRLGSCLRNKEAVFSVLKPCLESPDVRIRANCIEAFELLGDPKCIELLAPLLRDSDNRVKANAVKALWRFGNHDAFSYLEKMIVSKDEWSRDSAVYALGYMSGPRAQSLLEKCLCDPSDSVAANARSALDKIKTKAQDKNSAKAISGYFIPLFLLAFVVLGGIYLVHNLVRINFIDHNSKKNGSSSKNNDLILNAPHGFNNKDLADFHFNNAQILFEKDNLLKASEECRKAMKFLPEKSVYYYFLASIHEKTGNIIDEARVYKELLNIHPEDKKALRRLADIHIYTKEYAKAYDIISRLLADRPENSRLLALQALCLSYIGDSAKSEKLFKKAYELDPEDSVVNNSIGIFCRKKGDFNKAREHFEKSYNNLAITLIDMKQLDQAAALLRKIILMAPKSWVAQQARIVLSGIHEK